MSLERDITEIKTLIEKDGPIFKAASPKTLANRPQVGTKWIQITSINQLRRLAKYGVEVVLRLGDTGMLVSRKYVSYDLNTEEWDIDSYIDGSRTDHLYYTNIPTAIEHGALWYDRNEYVSSHHPGLMLLPEANEEPIFKAASQEQLAHRREIAPPEMFHQGREHSGRSNYGVSMAFANGRTRGRSLNMHIENPEEGVTTLYSYGTPIALRQNGVVFYCTRKYSHSTSMQQSNLRAAAGGRIRMIEPREFMEMLHAVGVYDMGRLREAGRKPIFKSASQDVLAQREEAARVSAEAERRAAEEKRLAWGRESGVIIKQHADEAAELHGEWAGEALSELSFLMGVEIKVSEYQSYKEFGAVDMECFNEMEEGSNGESAWVVFENYDIAEKAAISRVANDLESDPGTYMGDWAFQYMDDDRCESFFQEIYDEWNRGYAEDIMSESSRGYTNRLAAEMVERGIIDDNEGQDENFDLEDKIDEFVEQMTKDQMDEGQNGYAHYESNFGEEDARKLVIEHNLIDIDAAAQGAVDADGVAHTLDGYDSEELELPSGAVAYGTN